MKKLILSVISIAILLFGANMLSASAASSGTCGENLSWALNEEGTLVISGTGDMDYISGTGVPWASYVSDIKTVVIKGGVTTIGNDAFSGYSNLTSVTIPNSVRSIGSYAFYNCDNLKSVYITDLSAWCSINFFTLTTIHFATVPIYI